MLTGAKRVSDTWVINFSFRKMAYFIQIDFLKHILVLRINIFPLTLYSIVHFISYFSKTYDCFVLFLGVLILREDYAQRYGLMSSLLNVADVI